MLNSVDFLTIAIGSASEVEYLILLSKDLNYLDLKTYEKLNEDINTIKRKIYSLKQKLN
jgi:four helix bundle protein